MATKLYELLQGNRWKDPVMIGYDANYTATRSGTTITVTVNIWSFIYDSTSCNVGSSAGVLTQSASITYGGNTFSKSAEIKGSEKWYSRTDYGGGQPPYTTTTYNSSAEFKGGVKKKTYTLTVTGVGASVSSLSLVTKVTSSGSNACGTMSSTKTITIPTASAPSGVVCTLTGGGSRNTAYDVTCTYDSSGANGGGYSTRGIQISKDKSTWTTFSTNSYSATVTPADYDIGYNTTFYIRGYVKNVAGLITYSSVLSATTAARPAAPTVTLSGSPAPTADSTITITASATGSKYAIKVGGTVRQNTTLHTFSFKPSAYSYGAGDSIAIAVTAYNAYGDSSASAGTATAYVAQKPNAPTNVKVDKPTPNLTESVTVTWDAATVPANSGTIKEYKVYVAKYDKSSAAYVKLQDWVSTGTTRSYTLKLSNVDCTVNDTLRFSVRAVSSLGNESTSGLKTFVVSGAMMYTKVNGTYKHGLVWYKHSGTWKLAANVYKKTASTWKESL